MSTEHFREERTDLDGDYTEIWFIPPPPIGQRYRVLRQKWNAEGTERRIYSIQVVKSDPLDIHPPGG